jgi:hypothetical protein
MPSIQNFGFDMTDPTPKYKVNSKEEVFGFANAFESN